MINRASRTPMISYTNSQECGTINVLTCTVFDRANLNVVFSSAPEWASRARQQRSVTPAGSILFARRAARRSRQ